MSHSPSFCWPVSWAYKSFSWYFVLIVADLAFKEPNETHSTGATSIGDGVAARPARFLCSRLFSVLVIILQGAAGTSVGIVTSISGENRYIIVYPKSKGPAVSYRSFCTH